jgi:hypothetical protein
LSPDTFKLICQYLDFSQLCTLFATNSRLLRQKMILPGVIPKVTLQHHSSSGGNDFLCSHTGLQQLLCGLFIHSDTLGPLPCRSRESMFGGSTQRSVSFLALLSPQSLTSLTLTEPCLVSVELKRRLADATFQTLFPRLKELNLFDRSLTNHNAGSPLLAQLMAKLPQGLEKLSLAAAFGWPKIEDLPSNLKSLTLCDANVIKEYAPDAEKPMESIVRALAERLPHLVRLMLLMPKLALGALLPAAIAAVAAVPQPMLLMKPSKPTQNSQRNPLSGSDEISEDDDNSRKGPSHAQELPQYRASHDLPAPAFGARAANDPPPGFGGRPQTFSFGGAAKAPTAGFGLGAAAAPPPSFGATAAPSFGATAAPSFGSSTAAAPSPSFGAPSNSFANFGVRPSPSLGSAATTASSSGTIPQGWGSSAATASSLSGQAQAPQASSAGMDVDTESVPTPVFPHLEELELDILGATPELIPILRLCSNVTTLRIACHRRIELGSAMQPIEYPPSLTLVDIRRRKDDNEPLILSPSVLQNLPSQVVSLRLDDIKFEFGETLGLWGGHSLSAEPHPELRNVHWQTLLPPHLTHLLVSGLGVDLARLPPRLERLKQQIPNRYLSNQFSFLRGDFSRLPSTLTELVSTNLSLPIGHISRLPTSLAYLEVPVTEDWHQEHVLALHHRLPHCRVILDGQVPIHAPLGSAQHVEIFGELNHDSKCTDVSLPELMEQFSRPFRSHISNQWALSLPVQENIAESSNATQHGTRPSYPSVLYGATEGLRVFGVPPPAPRLNDEPSFKHVLNLPPTITRWNTADRAGVAHDMQRVALHLSEIAPTLREFVHTSCEGFSFFNKSEHTFPPGALVGSKILTVLELGDLDASRMELNLLPPSLTVFRGQAPRSQFSLFRNVPIFSASDLPPNIRVFAHQGFRFGTLAVQQFPVSLTELSFKASDWTDKEILDLKSHLVNLVCGTLDGPVRVTGDVAAPTWRGPYTPQLHLHAVMAALSPFKFRVLRMRQVAMNLLPEEVQEMRLEFDHEAKPTRREERSGPHLFGQLPSNSGPAPFSIRRLMTQNDESANRDFFEEDDDGASKEVRFDLLFDEQEQLTRLPPHLTSLSWLCGDCPAYLIPMLPPTLTRLALVIPGDTVTNPFHLFPANLIELTLYCEASIHCTAAGFKALPKSLTLLRCDQLMFPPALISSFPSHIVDIHFNGGNIWADTHIVALGNHIGVKLVKIRVDSAIPSGAFIPLDAAEITEESIRNWTSAALGSQYECQWGTTVAKPLSFPDSVTSLHFKYSWLSAFPRHFNSFPSQLTSLSLNIECEITAWDVQLLPATVRELSLFCPPMMMPELDEWLWSFLPRNLHILSIEEKKPKGNSERGGHNRPPLMQAELPISHALIGLPSSLEILHIPKIQIGTNCIPHLPFTLKSIRASSKSPNKLSTRIVQHLPNAKVSIQESSPPLPANVSFSRPHPNTDVGRFSFDL